MMVAARAALAIAAAMVASVPVHGQEAAPQPIAPTELFARNCSRCHGPGGWGTRALAKRSLPDEAELLNRKTIPAEFVRRVVRHGIGSMPPFTPTDLSDAQLDRLSAWLEHGR